MKTSHSTMWKWCAGVSLALGLCIAAPQASADVLVGWDVTNQTSYGVSPLAPSSTLSGVTVNTNLTKKAGNSGTAAGNAWGGTGFNSTTSYWYFTVSPSAGKKISHTNLVINYRRTATGPTNALVQYRVGGGSLVDITSIAFPVTASTGSVVNVNLSGVSALQDCTDPITFWVTPTNASASTGPWYIFNRVTGLGGNDMFLEGTVADAAAAPTLTSPTATSIGQAAATLGANITSDGGAALSERGTVYGPSSSPTINGAAEGGTATGVFSHERTSLSQGTKYFYRGYAVNSAGTGYSPDGSFYTEPGQATNVTFSNVGGSGMRISWYAGPDCDGSIVVVREGNAAVADPTDGTLPAADANFGDGDDLGDGSFVVYRGSSTQVDVTGLSASTTYYVEIFAYKGAEAASGDDQGTNYRQLEPAASSQATAASAPTQWTHLEQRGAPVYSYYLGDSLAYQFDFAINTDTTGWTVEYGLGTTQNGSGWTWRGATYSGQDGNWWWKSKAGEQQFTSTGAWYYAGQFINGSYIYYAANSWEANGAGSLTATNYFTVNALTAPSSVSAAQDGTYPATRVDLGWTQWNSKNVLITRATATPSGSPVNGTAYSANDTFGNQTVVSGSQSGAALEVTGLIPGQTYYFTFYSENSSYYSVGETAASVATILPQAKNSGAEGVPQAPATIFLGDTGQTFGFGSWGQIEANYGAARLWLRYNDADLTGGTASDWTSFVNTENKTRVSGVFNQIGTWYWGMQMDYGAEYGTAFWYKAASADWADLSASGSGASLTVTVSAINDPSDQSATADQTSQINLLWSNNAQDNDVMVVRKLAAASWTEPTQGTSYSASDTLGAGTVVYKGDSGIFYDTGLSEGTTYDYKFYSINNDYYSAGVTAQETTLECEPDAPVGLGAVADYTSFTASWDATDRATGYRLDVSTEAEFQTAGNGELIISEVADPLDVANAKFVELYNGTGAAIDFGTTPWYLARQANGLTWANTLLTGVIPAGGTYVVAYNQTSYETAFGTAADQYSGNISGNGDDGYFLVQGGGYSTGTVVDAYGVIDQDGTGYAWEYLDKNAVRNADVAAPNATWTASEWTIPGTTVNTTGMDPDAHTCTGDTAPSFVAGFENLAVAGTSQSVTGLTEGVTYYFRVRAEGEGGCPSVSSTTASTTTREHLRAMITPETVNVREGGEGRFFVRLNQDPGGVVEVAVSHSSGDAGIAIQGATTTLTFRSSSWSAWQAVTLTAPEDENSASETATFLVALAGAADEFAEAATLDDEIGDNLASAAVGATLTAWRGYRLSHLIDGVHAVSTNYAFTTWTSVPPGTITLDLQATTVVSRVRLLTWDWNYRNHQYTIESSLNGSSWSTLVDASTGEHRGWEDWTIGDAQVRYLRFTGLTNSVNAGFCVPELEVYGARLQTPTLEFSTDNVLVREAGEGRLYVRMTEAPEGNLSFDVELGSGDADVALQGETTLTFKPSNWTTWQGVTLTAGADGNAVNETGSLRISTVGAADQFVDLEVLDVDIGENVALAAGGAAMTAWRGYRLAEAIDGVHAVSTNYAFTTWTSVPPGTFTLDMQTAMTVSRVRILTWDWNYRDHRYTIESSADGSTWSMLADASAGAHRGWEDWAVADAQIRYLRFTGQTNSVNAGVCVPELEVYGTRPLPELIQLSKTSVNVREGGEGRFFVRLASAPAANVVISVARTAGDESLAIQSGASLTFKPSNWSTWQKVTLAQVADVNAAAETATLEVSMPGVAPRTVSVAALDDDIGDNLALASAGATLTGRKAYYLPYVIDGIHTALNQYGYTIWTNVPPGTMTLDLGSAAIVSHVRLLNWDWTYRVHQYTIESSTDGENWSTLVDATTGAHHGWEDWSAGGETIRYLRFTGLDNSANTAVCLSELEVIGTRVVGRRALKGAAAIAESEPVAVLTSAGPEDETGWNAVDGDDATAWTGQQAGGGYLVVEYAPTLELSELEVDVAEGALADAQVLTSLDGQDWQPLPEDLEANPVSLNFLWLVFPDDGAAAVPEVIEIRPNP